MKTGNLRPVSTYCRPGLLPQRVGTHVRSTELPGSTRPFTSCVPLGKSCAGARSSELGTTSLNKGISNICFQGSSRGSKALKGSQRRDGRLLGSLCPQELQLGAPPRGPWPGPTLRLLSKHPSDAQQPLGRAALSPPRPTDT